MEQLHQKYDELQRKYGAKDLNSVYGYGCFNNARVALVFMNPTKRNVATSKEWSGIKAQWLGTKQIWDFLTKCNLFDENLNQEIKSKKREDWTYSFCEKVYGEVTKRGIWITNLAKCTQEDARPLSDDVFLDYKGLLMSELEKVNPHTILFFGNQVSSIMLDEDIKVSASRLKKYSLKINNKEYESYAVYYPVGNGRFNQDKAIEDIKYILELEEYAIRNK